MRLARPPSGVGASDLSKRRRCTHRLSLHGSQVERQPPVKRPIAGSIPARAATPSRPQWRGTSVVTRLLLVRLQSMALYKWCPAPDFARASLRSFLSQSSPRFARRRRAGALCDSAPPRRFARASLRSFLSQSSPRFARRRRAGAPFGDAARRPDGSVGGVGGFASEAALVKAPG